MTINKQWLTPKDLFEEFGFSRGGSIMTLPQKHRSKWIKEEIELLRKSIEENEPLEEISKVISNRTAAAILTKANTLGYGYKYNKNDGLTYFKDVINHKNRSCKKKAGTTGNNDNASIPKIEVNIADLDEIIALHKEIITPHINIINQLEMIKSKQWSH